MTDRLLVHFERELEVAVTGVSPGAEVRRVGNGRKDHLRFPWSEMWSETHVVSM